MQNVDHQISRQVVNYAIKNNVKQINLETLANIRATTRQSRKNGNLLIGVIKHLYCMVTVQ